jgi:4-methyl-5(b-hydroxyethyl)-thiazole monophosphate biosynthesis
MKKVLLLLCEGIEIYEAAAFYDVLGWANEYGSEKIKVVTVGLQKEVRGTFGIGLISDAQLSDIKVDDFDVLAVPGGFETHGFYREAYSEPVANLVRQFNEQGKIIASICVGALLLANSGILKGRQATTYNFQGGIRQKQLAEFGVNVVNQPIVHDGNVITSYGPATAISVAFELLEELTGSENASHIRQMMGFQEKGQTNY